MRYVVHLALAIGLLGGAGCGKKEEAPAAPVKSKAELQREEFFGAAVAADPAVVWKPTGLGIKIVAPGDGPLATASDNVRIRYTGRLKDGTIFDASPGEQSAEFALSRMIRGMTEGISTLRPGGRAVLYVPPSLGYGSLKVGKIPPVSPLIFEVELVGLNP